MLSRRNVRIKVMQTLYAVNRDQSLTESQVPKEYWKTIDDSFKLLLFSLYNMIKICEVSIEDADKRKTKHVPTPFDRKFIPILYKNGICNEILGNISFLKKIEGYGFEKWVDHDQYKKIYYDFCKEDYYVQFFENNDFSDGAVIELLLELFRFLRRNEIYVEMMEDHFAHWEDDKSLIIGAIKKIIKSKPQKESNFYAEFLPDKEATKEYGEYVLVKFINEEKNILPLIEAVLQNWDADRVAIIDMILIKMAVIEFLYCPTIPAKVTINEYLELAKNYSTSKSKDFINGVLDKILQDLLSKGLVNKEERLDDLNNEG